MSQQLREAILGELFKECKNKVCDNLFSKRFSLNRKIEMLKNVFTENELDEFAKKRIIKIIEETDYDDLSPEDKMKGDNMIEDAR